MKLILSLLFLCVLVFVRAKYKLDANGWIIRDANFDPINYDDDEMPTPQALESFVQETTTAAAADVEETTPGPKTDPVTEEESGSKIPEAEIADQTETTAIPQQVLPTPISVCDKCKGSIPELQEAITTFESAISKTFDGLCIAEYGIKDCQEIAKDITKLTTNVLTLLFSHSTMCEALIRCETDTATACSTCKSIMNFIGDIGDKVDVPLTDLLHKLLTEAEYAEANLRLAFALSVVKGLRGVLAASPAPKK